MRFDEKRTLDLHPSEVQQGNRAWWSANPMAYDWHSTLRAAKFSREWFDAIDGAFIRGSSLFATETAPFDRLIPFAQIRGRRVLEIGCGMGLHSELMAAAGADLVSVDLSDTSIEATRRRLELKGLKARVERVDAERLPFDDSTFDFIWSWGVIHHSSRTARIAREIGRVARKDGEARIMVYNREGMAARVALIRNHVLRGGFLKRAADESLFRATDGFSARYYVREQFEDLFRAFFEDVSCQVLGQEADVVPLPRTLRGLIVGVLPRSYLEAAQARRGAFLFLRARGAT